MVRTGIVIACLLALSTSSTPSAPLAFTADELNPVVYSFQRNHYCTPYGPAATRPRQPRYIGQSGGEPVQAPPLEVHPSQAHKVGLVEMWADSPVKCDLTKQAGEFYDSIWRDALRLETIVNYRIYFSRNASPGIDFNDYAIDDGVVSKPMLAVLTTDTTQTFGAQNDDVLWWALAFLRAYQADPKHIAYLQAAQAVFVRIEHTPEQSVCGGGVTWGDGTHYKNAITNTLYLALASRLAGLAAPGSAERNHFLRVAVAEADWLLDRSRLWVHGGVLADGLQFKGEVCAADPSPDVWTYSQGVALSGLAQLTMLTGNSRYADRAQALILRIADPTQTPRLVDASGILQEPATTPDKANEDAQVFKGIFACHLAYAISFFEHVDSHRYRHAMDAGRRLLRTNADAVWKARRSLEGRTQFAFSWSSAAGANAGPVNMRTTGAALELLTAAWAVSIPESESLQHTLP